MTIYYAAGLVRKNIVTAAANHLGTDSRYQGMPSAAYIIGNAYTISREATLTGPDNRELVEALKQQGIMPMEEIYDALPEQSDRLTIEVPIGPEFTAAKMANLEKLVASRATLLMKVLGTDALPIERADDVLRFPWFPLDGKALVYSQLACALVRVAFPNNWERCKGHTNQ